MPPIRPPRPCTEPVCRELVPSTAKTSRCSIHQAAWMARERERRRRYNEARGHTEKQGYGYAWRKIRKQALMAEPYCQCGARANTVDHIVPRSKGGGDDPGNLSTMCRRCHAKKTAGEDGGFGNES